MPILLQIDSCLGVLSTGRISEGIAKVAMSQGWDCYIAHGARYVGMSIQNTYQIESKKGEYAHYLKSLLFDAHGLGSIKATKKLIDFIERIHPTVIQLHCIHGYYLNYKILFEYLQTVNIPIVWTFHDCWAFTGHCAYFDSIICEKWKTGCYDCKLKKAYPKSIFLDRSKQNFELKKKLFNSIANRMMIVPVSYWLEDLVKQSFLKDIRVNTIHNGTNIDVFKPRETNSLRSKLNIGDKKVVLGVALPWIPRKGMPDMLRLADMLPNNEYQVILVGLNEKQLQELPKNVIGVSRTNSAEELSEYYSLATAFVNPTYEDNFPTTNIEALACGTPVITYLTGGSPEAVDEKTGHVVEQCDVEGLRDAIFDVVRIGERMREDCRERAVRLYDANFAFHQYIELYNEVLNSTVGTAWGG